MKRILLILLFPAALMAQQPFGYHTTWHYYYSEFGFYGFKKITHVSDTTMLGFNWLKFEVTGVTEIRTGPGPNDIFQAKDVKFDPIFLATRNDSVFRLLNDSAYYLLYDFTAGLGDKWQFAPHDTFANCHAVPIATVSGMGTESIKGVTVPFMDVTMPMDTVHYHGSAHYQVASPVIIGSRIYPDFGEMHYTGLFGPTPNLCNGASFKTTQLNSYTLRCFSNDSISINLTSGACDAWAYVNIDEFETVEFRLYPNPTTGELNIETEHKVEGVEIYSMDGQMVFKTSRAEAIELQGPAGVYMVVVYFENGLRTLRKVILEK